MAGDGWPASGVRRRVGALGAASRRRAPKTLHAAALVGTLVIAIGCKHEKVAPSTPPPRPAAAPVPATQPSPLVREHGFRAPASATDAGGLLLAADAHLLDGDYGQAAQAYLGAVDRLLAAHRRQEALFVAKHSALLMQAVARQFNKEPFTKGGYSIGGQPTAYQLQAMRLYRRYVDLLARQGAPERIGALLIREAEERREEGTKGSYLARIAYERAAALPGYHGAHQCAYRAAIERQWRYPHGGDLANRWEDALTTWQRFLQRCPAGPYAACAQAHMGELHLRLGECAGSQLTGWLKLYDLALAEVDPGRRRHLERRLAQEESEHGSPRKLYDTILSQGNQAKALLEPLQGRWDDMKAADLSLAQRLERGLPLFLQQLEEQRRAAERDLAQLEARRAVRPGGDSAVRPLPTGSMARREGPM